MRYATLMFATCLLGVACSQKPQDYSECVLENVKPEMNERAVALVAAACREQFPDHGEKSQPSNPDLDLPPEVVAELTGRLGSLIGGTWKGNIYNGNGQWLVTEVTIRISDPEYPTETFNFPIVSQKDGRQLKYEMYSVSVYVPPISNREFTLSVNWNSDEEYSWQIVNAKGRKTK